MLSNRISVLSVIAFIIFSLPIDKCDAVGLPSITIVGITDYRPYSYYENNEPKGLYNDILIELFRRSGYPLRLELVPFKRLLWMTENGNMSGMAGAFWTKEREQSATLIRNSKVLIKEIGMFDSKETRKLN
jgi:extracellular solute-binding protein (family 3)